MIIYPDTPKWEMRDGTVIPMERMLDSHLDNTIAMLERNVSMYRARVVARNEDDIGSLMTMGEMTDKEFLLYYTQYDELLIERRRREHNE